MLPVAQFLYFGLLTCIEYENQIKSLRHDVYYIIFMWCINVCAILCISFCSLEIPSALTVCSPHSRLLNQFQFAVSALVQKSKIGRRNLRSSSLVLTVATVVGDHSQGCTPFPWTEKLLHCLVLPHAQRESASSRNFAI